MPGRLPIMSASGSGRVDGLLRLAGSRIGPSTTWFITAMAIYDEQQRGNRLVDAAPVPQRAGERDQRAAGGHAGDRHRHLHDDRRRAVVGERQARRHRREAAEDKAPSPPMITSPICAGSAVQRAVSSSGEARSSVFCQENQEPKAPIAISW